MFLLLTSIRQKKQSIPVHKLFFCWQHDLWTKGCRKNVNSKFNRTALRLSLLLFHCALEASFEEVLGVNGISSLLPMSAAGLVKHIPDIKVNCTIYLFCIHSKRKPFCLSQQQHCSNS
ncbi:hypothetical protein Pst134EA_028116 [Puccinia striiformis f. sp. tritici]|uniref:hypothetical protein n=1 Tax=Puccinia striiformis f. sp. tritici TaxID=168172 RepID=UPI0020080506|nr:hypothetical protein Pst134EA_028116 [Puccinia striiformis f. sp. tritici]KAH9448821.1 hypothetical protein Pst134EA_028116 [Puccinia striiformis f. sp. tritici]